MDDSSVAPLALAGAGGSAVVLISKFNREVYRLRRNCPDTKPDSMYELDQSLSDRVIVPLIGREFLPETSVVTLEAEQLRSIQQCLERYGEHQLAVRLSSLSDSATISRQTNCCLLPKTIDEFCDDSSPTLCVELKPKSGVQPQHAYYVSDSNANRHDKADATRPMCRFCALQYHPRKASRWPTRSRYCPMDLYSGDRSRLFSALLNLLSTPQNNLAFFVDGTRVHASECKEDELIATSESYCGLEGKSQSLEKVRISASISNWSRHLAALFCASDKEREDSLYCALLELIADGLTRPAKVLLEPAQDSSFCLPSTCVLERLLRVQALESRVGDIMELRPLVESGNLKLKDVDLWSSDALGDALDFPQRLFANQSELSLCDRIRGYLLSALAKDVSLMITARRLKNDVDTEAFRRSAELINRAVFVVDLSPPWAPLSTLRFAVQVTVIDTAMKPVTKIEQHFKDESALRRVLGDPSTFA